MSTGTKKRRFRVVVTTRLGGTRQVYLIPNKGFSYRRGQHGRTHLTVREVEQAKRWAARRLARRVRVIDKKGWPFLELASGARWPTNQRLLRALNDTGRKRRRLIRIISGLRTPHEAWVLRMRFLAGRGNLAARCCSKYSGTHSWDACGKDPWSNHADGNAADCGTVTGLTGRYTSLADDRKARRLFQTAGGCFPVTNPWEPWHAEMRNT